MTRLAPSAEQAQGAVCIFHFPAPVGDGGTSGSSVRPYRLRSALAEAGFEVWSVTGRAAERARAARDAMRRIDAGARVAFAYSETHTMPWALTEPHHLPVRPTLDASFLRRLRARGVPIGLFYRDVYWRFEEHGHRSRAKRAVARFFYRREWDALTRHVDHLFLPSLAMAAHLPTPWQGAMSALPPGAGGGAVGRDAPDRPAPAPPPSDRSIRMLYVGGVAPPLYDLTPLFEWVEGEPRIEVTVCCRADEWRRFGAAYDVGASVTIVHASGGALEALYERADLFLLARRTTPYLEFAMPVKVFEAIEHGLPIVASPGTAASRFVEDEGIGWVVPDREAFSRLVARLVDRPAELEAMVASVAGARRAHSWRARARQIAETLSR